MWDQIPMLISRTTRTLFTEDIGDEPSVLTIDNAVQSQAQAAPAAMVGLFNSLATPFDIRSRRHLANAGFEYIATPQLTVRGEFQHTDREGTLPFGGSFGHSSFVEFPAPIKHRLTELDGGAEYLRDRLLFRAGYYGSFFHNDSTTATFDNPFRVTDIAATPSRGRLSLAPSNTYFTVNGTASVRLPYRSRATAYVAVGSLKDADDPLMPQTINSATVTAPLERSTVNGEARTTAVTLSFSSRPTRLFDFNAQYRSYEYDNRTPVFTMNERVSFDNTPAAVNPPVHSEPFGVLRHTFDADLKTTPRYGLTGGVGFSRLQEDRSHRIFHSTTDNAIRLTFDAVGTGMFSVRTKYEHAQRRGEGIDEGEQELAAIGEQPGMRHFDIAPRDRDRVTIVASISPLASLAVNGSFAAGKDDYRLELPRTGVRLEDLFGLRDNSHRVYSVGVDALPTAQLTVGGSYSFERYNALNRSRQANPGVQFTDPTRNWSAEGTDRVHSIQLTAGIAKIAEKFDVQLSYDYNRARARYEYFAGAVPDRTLPEETTVDTALPTPTALPLVKSDLSRGTADVVYEWSSRLGIGVSYWHERFDVTDFTLDADANPVLVRGQAILLGYLYRPYTANTFWGRLIYRF
jgi:MtrB/PioB family decaheme-associated outer membrane protein